MERLLAKACEHHYLHNKKQSKNQLKVRLNAMALMGYNFGNLGFYYTKLSAIIKCLS